MKGWAALALLLVAGTIVGLVLAITRTHDDVPDRIAGCIERSDGQIVRGPDTLGLLRADLARGKPPRVARRYELGDNRAVLLDGRDYRVLAVDGRDGPPLDGDVALRIYEQTSAFAVVGVERDPVKNALAACASLEE